MRALVLNAPLTKQPALALFWKPSEKHTVTAVAGRPATTTTAMFKPTQALFKRFRKLRLTTKDVNKGFYKGTRTGRMGTHDKWGGFTIDYNLVRTYVVPKNLDTFKVPAQPPPPSHSSPAPFFLNLC